jgi:hypothetical protein
VVLQIRLLPEKWRANMERHGLLLLTVPTWSWGECSSEYFVTLSVEAHCMRRVVRVCLPNSIHIRIAISRASDKLQARSGTGREGCERGQSHSLGPQNGSVRGTAKSADICDAVLLCYRN